MTTKQVILWCGDGDDGSGSAKIIDAATGQLLRDKPRPHVVTDSVEDYVAYGNYFYLVDSDSTLACFDKDNVFKARVDLGYNDNPGEAIWITSTGIHVLKKNKTFETFTVGQQNLIKVMTYALGTLAEVSGVVLAGADATSPLGDSTTNTSYIDSVDRVWATDESGFWVGSNNSTVFTSGFGFVKVSYAGVVLDTWEPAGVQSYMVTKTTDGSYYSMPGSGSSGFTWQSMDFSTKTLGAQITSLTGLSAAFTAVATHGLGNLSNFNKNDYDVFVEANGSITFAHAWSDGDVAGIPALDGLGLGGGVQFFNITNAGVVSAIGTPIALPYYDNEKRAALDPRYAAYPRCVRWLSGTGWVVGDNYGVWKVDAATSTMLWSFEFPFKTQQGYSSDGEDLSILKVDTWTSYALAGTVTDAAGVENRKVRVHDQRTGEVIAEDLTDSGGAYSVDVLSTNTKYIVCTSVDNTKNFGINAHIIPV